jgi:hypothetical protein
MNLPFYDRRDARQYAPATERNREPILNVLQEVLPPQGTVLEIASGTGEHAIFLTPRLAPLKWLPSDVNPIACASIAAWQDQQPANELYPPVEMDVCRRPWPIEQEPLPESLWNTDFRLADLVAIVNINMVHIAPWEACLSLMEGAGQLLPIGGILYLYGPFKQRGTHTAPSNASFDQSLRYQNPLWGVRDLEQVLEVARANHLKFLKTVEMPANNLSVVFQR